MKVYSQIKLKNDISIFIIPYIVEVLFIIFSFIWKNNSNLSMIHGLWFMAANAVIFIMLVWKNLKEYYFNSDELINILPQSKETIITLNTMFNIVFITVFDILGQYAQFAAHKNLSLSRILNFTLDKLIAFSSFFFLLNLIIILFKNIRQPKLGTALIVIVTCALVAIQIKCFWTINSSNIHSFFVGISSEDIKYTYLNVIPVGFFNLSKKVLTHFRFISDLTNILIAIVSIVGLFIFKKLKRNNYVNLVK